MAEAKGGKAMRLTAVRLPPETFDRLVAAAARLEDRSVAWCIRAAVEEWLARQANPRRKTR